MDKQLRNFVVIVASTDVLNVKPPCLIHSQSDVTLITKSRPVPVPEHVRITRDFCAAWKSWKRNCGTCARLVGVRGRAGQLDGWDSVVEHDHGATAKQ